MAVDFAEQKFFGTSLGLFASRIFVRSCQQLMLRPKIMKIGKYVNNCHFLR
jgi:hypothetical protein